ncbi:MAG: GNAT family N-acetyltransferase [Alphaproteobacteria bacterium]
MTDIRHETRDGGGRYVVEGKTGEQAWLSWRRSDSGKMEAISTFVPPSLRSEGLAMKLVERLVQDARENGETIIPVCSYIAHNARKRDDWSDVME